MFRFNGCFVFDGTCQCGHAVFIQGLLEIRAKSLYLTATFVDLDVAIIDAESQVRETCFLNNVVPFFTFDRRVEMKSFWKNSVILESVVEVQVVFESCDH